MCALSRPTGKVLPSARWGWAGNCGSTVSSSPRSMIPSSVYVLNWCHLFSVLEPRGPIGVTEGAGAFRRMAAMAGNAGKAYLDQRQRLECPLIDNGKAWPVAKTEQVVIQSVNGKV